MSLGDQDLEDQVVTFLRRAGQIRGRNTLGEAIASAELDASYLRKMPPGSVGMRNVRKIAEGFGMDAREAIRYAMDTGGVRRFVEDGQRLAPEVRDYPKPMNETVGRMRVKWAEDDGGLDLDAIDAQRYNDPRAALAAIEDALGVVSGPRTYARALGIWGSAQRGVYRLDYATTAIGLAIEAAQSACDRELLCESLVRAASVIRDRGELDWALEVGDALLELRASTRSFDGMGRAYVVHGSLLRNAGSGRKSIRCNRAALELLDEESVTWRFSAFQSLSIAQAGAGSLDSADGSAQSAQALGLREPHRVGRLSWIRARIAQARGDFRTAAEHYRAALGGLSIEPVDAALAGAEFVRVLLQVGRVREAQVAASKLSPLADRVSEHPFDFDHAISAALLDITRRAGSKGLDRLGVSGRFGSRERAGSRTNLPAP